MAGKAAVALVVASTAVVGPAVRTARAAPEVVPPVATRAAASAPAACAPKLDSFDRVQSCVLVSGRVYVLRGAARVGAITFGITHFMQLSASSRDFTEHITISGVRVTGSAGGVHLSLRVSCGSPCAATVRFPQDEVIADGLTATVDYHDGVAAGRAQETRSLYTLEFTKPGDRPASFSYRLPIAYRCDDELPGVPAGCVLPAYLPYLRVPQRPPAAGVATAVSRASPGAWVPAAREPALVQSFYASNRILQGDPFWVMSSSVLASPGR